ncbi:sulfurtransferase [Peribacillus cavernae]|uniref:Sulfurtransferase n=1 Tax=Peribacillus cavernae TaxID=1674310 RepID=A0A433HL26_9BACI|nr:sulfurtransferase [Peribacillus cavernae]MDQ0218016.1 thiosulfate/3-mercaptopyruvate sulfurtransferase [Peribacillus cavernae]RUQ28939.1 sulfurtransferase [Peribacillus cavernae]
MGFFISKEEVLELVNNHQARIVDCRFQLGNTGYGEETYREVHIPGAVFFNTEKDLSGPTSEHGGRHPLPDLQMFRKKLEEAGISNDTTVVAYDAGKEPFASRLIWMLTYIGHKKAYLLNGGFQAWQEAGLPVDTDIPHYHEESYQLNINEAVLASYEEVKSFTKERPEDIVLVDSREEKRFLGIEESIDKKAGHIPGAVNKFWAEGLSNGMYGDSSRQSERFSEIDPSKQLIVYCGSGISAAPNFLALKEAGYENVKLYVGSFSDWISYQNNPIETKKS